MQALSSQSIIEFEGILTFNTISHLLPKLKEALDNLGEKINTYKRILTITIETLENSYRYIENNDALKALQSTNPSRFSIVKTNELFEIISGNLVKEADREIITTKITKVNNLDETGLRELYKKTIANGQFSAVGGAGLGFIEIAKASGEKIHFDFAPVANEIFYYTVKLFVKP